MTDQEIRKRLLAAGRHLTPTTFGSVVTRIATPGLNWAGCSKGDAIKEATHRFQGRGTGMVVQTVEVDFTIEELEEALRQEAQPRKIPGPGYTRYRYVRHDGTEERS